MPTLSTPATARHPTTGHEPRPVRHGRFIPAEALLLLLAVVLAVAVKMHPAPLPGDVGLIQAWQRLVLPHRALTGLIDDASTINWPQPSAVALVIAVVLLLVLRRWLDAGLVLLVAALADGSSYLTNELVRRPRPLGHGVHVLQHIGNYYSFPSGHVVHALAVFGFVVFLTYRTLRSNALLWLLRAVLLVLIVVMGPSRLLEGEHWPSDVLEGLLYGAFWLILGMHLYAWAAARWSRLAPPAEHAAIESVAPYRSSS